MEIIVIGELSPNQFVKYYTYDHKVLVSRRVLDHKVVDKILTTFIFYKFPIYKRDNSLEIFTVDIRGYVWVVDNMCYLFYHIIITIRK